LTVGAVSYAKSMGRRRLAERDAQRAVGLDAVEVRLPVVHLEEHVHALEVHRADLDDGSGLEDLARPLGTRPRRHRRGERDVVRVGRVGDVVRLLLDEGPALLDDDIVEGHVVRRQRGLEPVDGAVGLGDPQRHVPVLVVDAQVRDRATDMPVDDAGEGPVDGVDLDAALHLAVEEQHLQEVRETGPGEVPARGAHGEGEDGEEEEEDDPPASASTIAHMDRQP
jgi:hypothetical protein